MKYEILEVQKTLILRCFNGQTSMYHRKTSIFLHLHEVCIPLPVTIKSLLICAEISEAFDAYSPYHQLKYTHSEK